MATKTPSEAGPEDRAGKKVFTPGELNNAGEDKDYFPQDKSHKFSVPKDANNHALTPDIEVTPDHKVKPVH